MKITPKSLENLSKDVLTTYIEYMNDETTAQKVKDNLKLFYEIKAEIDEAEKRDEMDVYFEKPDFEKILNSTQYYMDTLSELNSISIKAHNKFVYEINTLIQLFSMFVIAETSISKDIEYNKLVEAIPKEAKEKISKELVKARNIKKASKELTSLDFVLSEPFVSDINRHVDNATYQYAIMYFCILIVDAVIQNNKLEAKTTYNKLLDIQEYEYFKDCARVLFDFGDARLNKKEFHETKFYKLYSKFIELDKVITQEDTAPLKQAVSFEKCKLLQSLDERKKAVDLITECSQELFKQGWWYGD